MRNRERKFGERGVSSSPPPSGARLEPHEAEVSSSRARLLDDVPTVWLDQLLAAVLDLPTHGGEVAVAESLLDSVAAILPNYAVGLCLVPARGADLTEPVISTRVPPGMIERPAGGDPTRIFPGFSSEYVALVPGSGSTMHLASDDHELDGERSPAAHLLERAAMVLGRALPKARAAGTPSSSQSHRAAAAFDQRMVHADKLATFGQVAAGVVHELNNPLTSIVAYSDYLIRRGATGGWDPGDVDRLRRIGEAANWMLRFTRDLVNYARPSSGAMVSVAVNGVIDRALAFCEHVLAGAGMRVERNYGPDTLAVLAVSEQLVQVFVNLITNACQAAPASEGRLLVTTAFQAGADDGTGRAFIFVEDNGSGIASEHLQHVFVPFFTTKGESNGTGLGLSIVKSIVQSHEGDIRVESQRGVGTRFIIELPVRT
jgi:two-component system NtrC family sensor kinase